MKRILLAILALGCITAAAQTCVLKRGANGKITRSTAAVNAFKRTNACPATGKASTASCPGYIVDHVVPLCACGEDTPGNMQWQTLSASKAKDKLEDKQCAALKKSGAVK